MTGGRRWGEQGGRECHKKRGKGEGKGETGKGNGRDIQVEGVGRKPQSAAVRVGVTLPAVASKPYIGPAGSRQTGYREAKRRVLVKRRGDEGGQMAGRPSARAKGGRTRGGGGRPPLHPCHPRPSPAARRPNRQPAFPLKLACPVLPPTYCLASPWAPPCCSNSWRQTGAGREAVGSCEAGKGRAGGRRPT